MTKNKRFFILVDDDIECIRDRTFTIKDIYGHYKYDDLEEICKELNELVDTNRELSKENEQLKDELFDVTTSLIYETSSNINEDIEKTRKEIYGDVE